MSDTTAPTGGTAQPAAFEPHSVATVFSPAKVNLQLEIGARRADGFHDARSIMQALTLHDTVTMRCEPAAPGTGLQIDVRCTTHEGIPPLDVPSERNIAYAAVEQLACAFGRAADEHIDVHIDKHIPYAAGMGGGSSNAAAALVGVCWLWGADLASPEVFDVAAHLGADVPFFLCGGCVELIGRGDVPTRTFEPARGTVLVVKPEAGVSTGEAYAAFDALGLGIGSAQACASASEPAADATPASGSERACANDLTLSNNLAAASESVLPELSRVREWLAARPEVARDARTGEPRVLLSGSGSATFAVLDAADVVRAAADAVSAARLEGWWARSCSFSPVGVRVIEAAAAGGVGAGAGATTNLGAAKRIW